jgi:hypothetical protein
MANPAMTTRADVALLLEKLSAAYGKKFSDADLDAEIESYSDTLDDLPLVSVQEAVRRAIKDEFRWPVPAKLRRLAVDTPSFREWKIQTQGDIAPDPSILCPDCGEAIEWHLLVKLATGFVFLKDFVNHQEGCGFRWNTQRMLELYGYAFTDRGQPGQHLPPEAQAS